jgi:hypothetical protein
VKLRTIGLCALLCSAACGSHKAPQRPGSYEGPELLKEKWGIEAVSLRPTFGGAMLDFRFKVIDGKKAQPLFDKKVKPYLFDRASGATLGMPEDTKLGSLRSGLRNPPTPGKLYYVLFANGHGSVRRGSRVDVMLGSCRLENMSVD